MLFEMGPPLHLKNEDDNEIKDKVDDNNNNE